MLDAPEDEITSQPRCFFCGEAERIEIWEIWSDHNFTLNTCCQALLEHVSAEMHDDPRWARDLLCRLGAEALTGHRLRRITDGESSHPVLDFQLHLAPVRFAVARAFIARHHAHRPPPVTWRWGSSVWNGPTMLGVVTVGNPVARAYMHRGIVEVNRLCIRRDVPSLLRWNGASMLLARASREAKRLGYTRIVTYTHADEDGTSLLMLNYKTSSRAARRLQGRALGAWDEARSGTAASDLTQSLAGPFCLSWTNRRTAFIQSSSEPSASSCKLVSSTSQSRSAGSGIRFMG